jgi:hypothetical protein
LAQQFRERWQAVEAQEQQTAFIALRWQQLNAILRLAIGLNLPLSDLDAQEMSGYQRWAKLKSSVMTPAEEIVPLLAPLNALRQLFARFDERGTVIWDDIADWL